MLTSDVIHQVEVVATFLDESSACLLAEAIPVVDLGIERLAMLTNTHLMNLTDAIRFYDLDQFCDRRHVAILESHPDQLLAIARPLDDVSTIFDGGTERLLDEDVKIREKRILQDGDVGVVGSCDDDGIDETRFEQVLVVRESLRWGLIPLPQLGERTRD